MTIYWVAKAFTFIPVTLQASDHHIVGSYVNSTTMVFQKMQYTFAHTVNPISSAFTSANEISVLNTSHERLAVIRDPQWLKPIEILLSANNVYTLVPKKTFAEHYSISYQNKTIGEFHEQFFALTPRGCLEIEDPYGQNNLLLVSIAYMCIYKRMIKG